MQAAKLWKSDSAGFSEAAACLSGSEDLSGIRHEETGLQVCGVSPECGEANAGGECG